MTEDTKKQSKNTAGLKPWKPGESGNPGGRPSKGNAIAEIIRKIGDEKSDIQSKRKRIEAVIYKAWEQAERGDDKARQFLVDRGWGKLPMEFSGDLSLLTPKELDERRKERARALSAEIGAAILEESDEE